MSSSRRSFLEATALAAFTAVTGHPMATAASADPPARHGQSLLRLSLAGYSFHRLMPRRGTPEEIARAEMNLEKFIQFCSDQRLSATELTGYYFPKTVTPEYLLALRSLLHRQGLSVSATAIGNDFCLPAGQLRDRQLAECREWIDYAAILGAPAIRIFAGNVPRGDTEDAAIERCAAGINESLQYAATKGVFLALENHGGITSTPAQMLKIIERVNDSDWFGVNFDSGNFQTDDPYADLAKIAPWAVNAQIKASVSIGGKKQPADFARITGILRDAGYRGFVALEYEESESPFTEIPRILDQLRPLCDG
ncbi:MAG: sugar phosphate isomerase/epimerase family protein [Planctomycetaceae bacterium]